MTPSYIGYTDEQPKKLQKAATITIIIITLKSLFEKSKVNLKLSFFSWSIVKPLSLVYNISEEE